MKYVLTILTALGFGLLSFAASDLLGWKRIQERAFVFAGGLFASAMLCARLW